METNDIDQIVTDVNHSFDHNQNVFTDKLDFNCDSNSSTLPPNSNNNILSPNDTIRSNNNASSSLDIEKNTTLFQQTQMTAFLDQQVSVQSSSNISTDKTKPKTDQMYKDELKNARNKIRHLYHKGTTYKVKSGRESMEWTVIQEYNNLQPVPVRNEDFLGIRDLKLKQRISQSALSMADLFLHLTFKDGEWERSLESMNKKILNHNDSLSSSRNSKGSGGGRRAIQPFSAKEFLIALALLIGAADCAEKGENLWFTKSNKKWKKHWVSISPCADFGRYMKLYRFKQFRQFIPKIFEGRQQQGNQKDPWWKFTTGITTFNEIRKKLILPSEVIVLDESMSAFRPQTTKTGKLPNITYIFRKPEDLGTEFKSSVCPVLGVMTYLEIQMGKDYMKNQKHFEKLGATASCTLRAAENLTRRFEGDMPEELLIGDSWFGSVKAAVSQVQAGMECCLQVKTNSALFPKKQIEEILKDCPGGTSMVLKGLHPTGIELVAIGYKYNKKQYCILLPHHMLGQQLMASPMK